LPHNVELDKQELNKLTTYLLNTRTAAVIQWSLQCSTDYLQREFIDNTTGTQSISQFLPHMHWHSLLAIWRPILSYPIQQDSCSLHTRTVCSVSPAKPTHYSHSFLTQPVEHRCSRLTHTKTKLTDLPTDSHTNKLELSVLNTDLTLVLSYCAIIPLTFCILRPFVPPTLTYKNSVFCPQRIYVFCLNLRTNSDYFSLQH